jgi:hypothetical protein
MSKKHKKQVSKPKKVSGPGLVLTARPRIIRALNDGRFVARTIGGIVKETSLTRAVVVKSLKGDKVLRGQMKVLPRKTSDGGILVTTKKHFREKAGFKDKFIDVFATKRITLNDID